MLSKFRLYCVLASLSACSPTPFIVTEPSSPKEAQRWPSSVELRTAEAEYWVTFARSTHEQRHAAFVSTRASVERIDRQQPHWLVLRVDGQSFRLERWVTRAQSGAGQQELVCYGEEPTPRCAREPHQGDRWIWKYVLPNNAVLALSHAKRVRVTLGLSPNPVYQDVEADETTWLTSFFAHTLPTR